MHAYNHRLSASGGGVGETSPFVSRRNRCGPHAEIFSRLIELEIKEGAACEETLSPDLVTGRTQNDPQSQIELLGCSMWPWGRGGKTSPAGEGNRRQSPLKLNRNIDSSGRNIGTGGAGGKIWAGHIGNRRHSAVEALTQDFYSGLTRARARDRGPSGKSCGHAKEAGGNPRAPQTATKKVRRAEIFFQGKTSKQRLPPISKVGV